MVGDFAVHHNGYAGRRIDKRLPAALAEIADGQPMVAKINAASTVFSPLVRPAMLQRIRRPTCRRQLLRQKIYDAEKS